LVNITTFDFERGLKIMMEKQEITGKIDDLLTL